MKKVSNVIVVQVIKNRPTTGRVLLRRDLPNGVILLASQKTNPWK